MPVLTRAAEFAGDLAELLKHYNYQPKLTAKLDISVNTDLTPELLNESVLWR